MLVQAGADGLAGLVPQDQGLGHLRPPQVDIAVSEAQLIGDLGLLVQRKGRGLAFVQDPQLVDQHLDFAGLELGVDHPLGPRCHLAAHGDDPLAPQGMSLGVNLGVALRIKDHLGEAPPVTQVDEDNPAVVSTSQYPAHQGDFLPDLGRAQIVAVMTALHGAHRFHGNTPYLKRMCLKDINA